VLGSQPFEAPSIQRHAAIHDVAYSPRFGDVLANLRIRVDQSRPAADIVGSRKMLVYDDIADDKVILYDKGVDVPPYSGTLEESAVLPPRAGDRRRPRWRRHWRSSASRC
jgi:hypothetical protein